MIGGQRFRIERAFLPTISKVRKSEIAPSMQEPQEEGPIAESMETRMCASSGGKSGHCRGRAASPDGVRHDIRGVRKRAECLQRSSIRRPTGGRPALASPDACRSLDWHAQGGCVCSGVHASWGVHAGRDPTGGERRLPLPQHLDASQRRAGASASDRLDLRRRIH